jgi:hypothetical protein
MRAREAARMRARKVARLKLDEEMRPFRRAAVDKNQTPGLLREVRKLLEIPVQEIAEKAELERSGIYDIEERELGGRAIMNSLARLAGAMDCKVVYGIVPSGGRTFEELYTERLWARLLGTEVREEDSVQ